MRILKGLIVPTVLAIIGLCLISAIGLAVMAASILISRMI